MKMFKDGGIDMNDKIIGIIGGMGPEATMDFYMKIIKATRVKTDQDHFRVVIDSNSKIPDRTKAILNDGESPVPALVETAKNLEKIGAEVGCISCITAHYFIDEIAKSVNYPILNAIEEVRTFIQSEFKSAKKIGVLATTGTIQTGLFDKYLEGYEVIYPNKISQQESVMEAIYGEIGIKSGVTKGRPIELLMSAGNELIAQGAEVLVAGCTELSIVLDEHSFSKPLIDPMVVLADVVVGNI